MELNKNSLAQLNEFTSNMERLHSKQKKLHELNKKYAERRDLISKMASEDKSHREKETLPSINFKDKKDTANKIYRNQQIYHDSLRSSVINKRPNLSPKPQTFDHGESVFNLVG